MLRSAIDQAAPSRDDIATMTERRLTFIVAGAGDPSNITEWYVFENMLLGLPERS